MGLLAGMRRRDQTRWRTRRRRESNAARGWRCEAVMRARRVGARPTPPARSGHHSEHHWEQRSCPLFGCDSFLERAVARRRAGALTRGCGGAKGRGGAAAGAHQPERSTRPLVRSISCFICWPYFISASRPPRPPPALRRRRPRRAVAAGHPGDYSTGLYLKTPTCEI